MSKQKEPTRSLTRETIYDVLSNQRRRYTLHYLAQNDGEVTLRDLSVQVSAWEGDIPPTAVTWQQRKNVYTALQQVHLPRMDEMGIVDFDTDRGEIALDEEASELQLYLDFVPENEIPWNRYYLGLSVFSGVALLLAESGIIPFSWLGSTTWASLFVLLFVLSATIHTYQSRKMRLGREGPPPGYAYERRGQR